MDTTHGTLLGRLLLARRYGLALLVLALLVLALLVLALGGAVHVRAQPFKVTITERPLPLRQLTTADGLPQNYVQAIVQDRSGFMWFGTREGLARYDGYAFVPYRHDSADATSLPHNEVTSLAEDVEGRLWTGTRGGTAWLDRSTGRFARVGTQPQGVVAADPYGVVLKSGDALYRAADVGAVRLVHRLRRGRYGTPAARGGGYLWFVGGVPDSVDGSRVWAFVHQYDGATRRLVAYEVPEPLPDEVDVLCWSGGRLWLGAGRLLLTFDPAREVFRTVAELPDDVSGIAEDAEGRLWVLASQWLGRIDTTRGVLELHPLRRDGTPVIGAGLYADRAGGLWFGSLFNGVHYYDPSAQSFVNLGRSTEPPLPLASDMVTVVREARDGAVWVGTLGGGLHRLSAALELEAGYRHDPSDASSLCHDTVWDVHEDEEGTLWIATDGGLCRLDPATGRFRRLPPPSPRWNAEVSVSAVQPSSGGALWIGYAGGLALFDTRAHRFRTFYSNSHIAARAGQLPFGMLTALHAARDGRVWIGTQWRGVWTVDPAAAHFTAFPLGEGAPGGRGSPSVWAFLERADGVLWIATDQGLVRVDPATGRSSHIGEAGGLPGPTVYSAAEGGEGQLWAGTNHGLVRIDERAGAGRRVRVYDMRDGVRNVEFNRKAGIRLRSGALLFGGTRGLTLFDPRWASERPRPDPPVVFTNLETTSRDGVEALPVESAGIVLRPGDYALSIAYAALDFGAAHRAHYRYRLVGLEREWVEAGTRRTAFYTNLAPGTYAFEVQSAGADGTWRAPGAKLAVTVRPPFWRTTWFLFFAGAAAGALALGAHRLRLRWLLREERLRLRIAHDLHDDLGSGLSSIALLSDAVQEHDTLDARARQDLGRIGQAARVMVGALREIVWSIDPSRDAPEHLVEGMRDAAACLLPGLDVSFDLRTEALPSSLPMELRRHLMLIYKEALHNVRHAGATCVTVRLDCGHGRVVLTVADDGAGFDPAVARSGTGMGSMHERAVRLGADLTIESADGAGTIVTCAVPMKPAFLVGHRSE